MGSAHFGASFGSTGAGSVGVSNLHIVPHVTDSHFAAILMSALHQDTVDAQLIHDRLKCTGIALTDTLLPHQHAVWSAQERGIVEHITSLVPHFSVIRVVPRIGGIFHSIGDIFVDFLVDILGLSGLQASVERFAHFICARDDLVYSVIELRYGVLYRCLVLEALVQIIRISAGTDRNVFTVTALCGSHRQLREVDVKNLRMVGIKCIPCRIHCLVQLGIARQAARIKPALRHKVIRSCTGFEIRFLGHYHHAFINFLPQFSELIIVVAVSIDVRRLCSICITVCTLCICII